MSRVFSRRSPPACLEAPILRLFGEGDTAPVTHEVLREADQCSIIYVSGK